MLAKLSRPLLRMVETKASIHVPGSPISAWINHVFGGVGNDSFEQKEAFASSYVWRAVNVLSDAMSGMNIGVFEKKENGDVVRVKSHPADYLLNIEPSPLYSAFTYRSTGMVHIGITGNFFSRIMYRPNGDLDEFLLLPPEQLTAIFIKPNRTLQYDFHGIDKILRSDEVLHVPGLSFNGFMGKNPIEAHRDTLVLDRESRTYGKKFYQNGAFLSGVLEVPGPLSDPAYARLKNSWHKAYGGSGNAGSTAILEEGTKFNPIRLSPNDAAWIATRKNIAEEVARIYGIPLHMLMELTRSTNNNIEHQGLEFVLYSVMPWVRRWEDELNRKLFKKRGEQNLFVRYDIEELMRGDMKTTSDYISKLQVSGNLTINEVRKKFLNLPGVEGGDKILVQANNMAPLEDVVNGKTILQSGTKSESGQQDDSGV